MAWESFEQQLDVVTGWIPTSTQDSDSDSQDNGSDAVAEADWKVHFVSLQLKDAQADQTVLSIYQLTCSFIESHII